jgi:hypothetical protein
MEKIGLFDFTKNFCDAKADLRNHPEFLRSYPTFMVNRVLSMSPKTCHLAMFMSMNRDIPPEQHFKFMLNEVPQESIYFSYYKRDNEVPKKVLDCLMEYYQCNLGRALEYAELMSQKQIDTIVGIYKVRDAKPKKRKVKSK